MKNFCFEGCGGRRTPRSIAAHNGSCCAPARPADPRLAWHVGLDTQATAMLNDLYNGVELDEARRERLLSLFRLEFADPSLMLPRVAGRPVYLAMAMDEAKTLRLKPQNLLVNLPLAARA